MHHAVVLVTSSWGQLEPRSSWLPQLVGIAHSLPNFGSKWAEREDFTHLSGSEHPLKVRKGVIISSTNGETEVWGGEEGRGGTGCRDRNVPVNDLGKEHQACANEGWVQPFSDIVWICMGMVEVWKHLGSARSRTPQEGVRVERAKDGDPFEPRRS